MERLTTNKNVADMGMYELAHNCCYIAEDGTGRYRDYDMDMDERDFARNLMTTLTGEDLPLEDESFDEEMMDNLMIDPFEDVKGLIALFYRNMWAMADLREKLKRYEDAEEQESNLKVGDIVYKPNPITKKEIVEIKIESIFITESGINISGRTTIKKYPFCCKPEDFGETVFLTQEEAEAKLKEMEGTDGK